MGCKREHITNIWYFCCGFAECLHVGVHLESETLWRYLEGQQPIFFLLHKNATSNTKLHVFLSSFFAAVEAIASTKQCPATAPQPKASLDT